MHYSLSGMESATAIKQRAVEFSSVETQALAKTLPQRRPGNARALYFILLTLQIHY